MWTLTVVLPGVIFHCWASLPLQSKLAWKTWIRGDHDVVQSSHLDRRAIGKGCSANVKAFRRVTVGVNDMWTAFRCTVCRSKESGSRDEEEKSGILEHLRQAIEAAMVHLKQNLKPLYTLERRRNVLLNFNQRRPKPWKKRSEITANSVTKGPGYEQLHNNQTPFSRQNTEGYSLGAYFTTRFVNSCQKVKTCTKARAEPSKIKVHYFSTVRE